MSEYTEVGQLKEKLEEIKSKLDSQRGQCSLLEEQINAQKDKLANLELDKEKYKKVVELLNFVQQVTKQKTKKSFERLVTYALRFIYSKEYMFELEFGRRGNLSEINFNVKTPDFAEAYDPLDSSGGGVLDILSLALRICLLELTRPKIEGFVVLDEPFKHLSSNYLGQAIKFLDVITKKIGRQIILITHKQELIEQAEYKMEIK